VDKIAIVGTGIAGLGCAHFLHRDHELTLFEQHAQAGGHSHTVTAAEPGTGRQLPIDTGFMVFNRVTYPLLCRLFGELGVAVKPTDMSFSVRHADSGLEFCGSSLNHLFAQRRNLLRPRFYRMLAAVARFNREAVQALEDPAVRTQTLREYARRRGYGEDFLRLYLLPMSSAVWSTPPERMLRFPAATLLRFFHNHGFLGLHTQHPWLTVEGGAVAYVEKLCAPWRHRLRLAQGARRVARGSRGVTVTTAAGEEHTFDRVILACHADQARRLLADPTPDEVRLLGKFRYQPNVATLHTDQAVMPRTRRAWASWNYETGRDRAGRTIAGTHYWMNSLQGVSDRENYFVSLNREGAVDPAKVLRTIHYEHPLFSLGAIQAQAELPALNESARGGTEIYYAGSYFRYGFHEDAFASAVSLCGLLLERDPWSRRGASEPDRLVAAG
jgi:predicted NAD/FAD-binding protein